MDAAELSRTATRYRALRGLFGIPIGGLFVAAGLTNMPPIGDEPVGQVGLFAGALVLAGVAYLLIDRYYRTTFGHIDTVTGEKVRTALWTVVAAVVICVGITVDTQAHLPISTYGLAYAVSLLAYYLVTVGARPHHWACLGTLAVLCALPVWGSVDDKVSLALVPMGLATMVNGYLDHRELVRSIRRVRASFAHA